MVLKVILLYNYTSVCWQRLSWGVKCYKVVYGVVYAGMWCYTHCYMEYIMYIYIKQGIHYNNTLNQDLFDTILIAMIIIILKLRRRVVLNIVLR